MGENATEGIYIAVYIFIFIVALSATITMFYMINNYAELSYEYGNNIENSGTLIENVPTTTYRIITGSELISYYFNYIKPNSSIYNVVVYEKNNNGSVNTLFKPLDKNGKNGVNANLDYKGVVAAIGDLSKTYYLSYESAQSNTLGKQTVNIKIEEIKEE